MKILLPTPWNSLAACVGALLFFPFSPSTATAQEGARNNEERLKRFLKQHPESDANQDGVLTMDEVRAFNRQRRENPDRPRASRESATPTHADVAYGDHEKQRFDIWLAESKDGKPTPLCIFIHGGGFQGGDKRVGAGTADAYLKEGISFASMNYRLSEGGKHPYPTAMRDSARGLQFIRSKAEEWNLDPDRIACYGGSAGAGISLWLGFHDDLADPDSSDPVARQSTRIVAAASTNGQSTYDLHTFREWFGVPDLKPHPALIPFYAVETEDDWDSERVTALMKDASAITHLTEDDKVPVYMTYNRGDVPVDTDTSANIWVHHVRLGLKLQEAMKKMGKECIVVSPEHAGDDPYGSLPAFMIAKLKGESTE